MLASTSGWNCKSQIARIPIERMIFGCKKQLEIENRWRCFLSDCLAQIAAFWMALCAAGLTPSADVALALGVCNPTGHSSRVPTQLLEELQDDLLWQPFWNLKFLRTHTQHPSAPKTQPSPSTAHWSLSCHVEKSGNLARYSQKADFWANKPSWHISLTCWNDLFSLDSPQGS